jgi:hypothetical protein
MPQLLEVPFEDIRLHDKKYYQPKTKKLVVKVYRLKIFEPTKFLGFTAGYKISEDKMGWEQAVSDFNDKVLDGEPKKGFDYQALADCLAWSYRNSSQAIQGLHQHAVATVVDMEATFGKYLKK